MKKNYEKTSMILKRLALLAVVFSLTLPFSVICHAAGDTYRVSVDKGYLALRTAKAYSSTNEIGELYSGDTVEVYDYSDPTYWYVYASSLGKYGYVNNDYLVAVNSTPSVSDSWTVSVSKGYLALRTAKAYSSANEIGELYSGDTVEVQDTSDPTYWYVYSPKHGRYGYVNKDYLIAPAGRAEAASNTATVSVQKGYLALRTAKAYSSANEIGELYSGDVVQIEDTSDNTYWYVYSPKHGRYGYVNKDYLILNRSPKAYDSDMRTVSVSKGYLALRSAKAYDSSNEIGELYSGDVVEVIETNDPTYWYVYSPKHSRYGYVNKDYLVGGGNSSSYVMTRTVRVNKGYLALRTAKSYSTSNEIGELYTGDTVEVQDTSDNTYWYVYSPKHGRYGYVNKDYLY